MNTSQHKPVDPGHLKILLGLMGERIVASHLRNLGHRVDESLNPFDSEKDMLVDGLPVEVKTQVPVIVEDSFGVSPKQRNKILSCHRVYWLSVPFRANDELAGWVFEMNPADANLKAHRWYTNNGREMLLFPRRQTAMLPLFQITDTVILGQLRKLSTSYL